MKRKITSAVLIALGLGFLWQASGGRGPGGGGVGQGPADPTCLKGCQEAAVRCEAAVRQDLRGRREMDIAVKVFAVCVERMIECRKSCVAPATGGFCHFRCQEAHLRCLEDLRNTLPQCKEQFHSCLGNCVIN